MNLPKTISLVEESMSSLNEYKQVTKAKPKKKAVKKKTAKKKVVKKKVAKKNKK